jgi:hypothetical protein
MLEGDHCSMVELTERRRGARDVALQCREVSN